MEQESCPSGNGLLIPLPLPFLTGAGAAGAGAGAGAEAEAGELLRAGAGAADDVTSSVDVAGVETAIELGATLDDVVKAILAWTTGGTTVDTAMMLVVVLEELGRTAEDDADDGDTDDEEEAICSIPSGEVTNVPLLRAS